MSLSFQDLQKALDTTSGTLEVECSVTLQSDSIKSLLEDFLGGTLSATAVQPAATGKIKVGQQTVDTVVVAGTLASPFLRMRTNPKLTAQFYLLDGVAQVRITLTGLPDPWKLSSSFPSLDGSDADTAELHECVFQVDSLRPDLLARISNALFVADDVALASQHPETASGRPKTD